MKLPTMQAFFPHDIARLANVLLRYTTHQPPGFAAGVRGALAEACGVEQNDLTPITDADTEALLAEVQL